MCGREEQQQGRLWGATWPLKILCRPRATHKILRCTSHFGDLVSSKRNDAPRHNLASVAKQQVAVPLASSVRQDVSTDAVAALVVFLPEVEDIGGGPTGAPYAWLGVLLIDGQARPDHLLSKGS